MRVRLSDPTHLDELNSALRQADCVSVAIEHDTLVVLHPFAVNEAEAATEIAFFVRAWRTRRPGLEVEVAV